MHNQKDEDIGCLIGRVVERIDGGEGSEELVITMADGDRYMMTHYQDCCETVSLYDVCGDLDDLIGSRIVEAEEVTSEENPSDIPVPSYQDSFTWTFYKLRTEKGFVSLRWYGESNGYYSESVDFVKLT